VPTSGKEKTGYPNQKPEGILRRVLQPSSREGDWVLDFFAGSGTTGAVAAAMGRRFVLVDHNVDAVDVMRRRLAPYDVAFSELP
jgi:site-specific DNA-methyltransferase (adenine-specific)